MGGSISRKIDRRGASGRSTSDVRASTSLFAARTCFVHVRTRRVRTPTCFIRDRASRVRARTCFIHDRTCRVRTPTCFIHDRTSLVRGRTCFIHDRTSLVRARTCFSRDPTSLVRTRTSFVRDPTSLVGPSARLGCTPVGFVSHSARFIAMASGPDDPSLDTSTPQLPTGDAPSSPDALVSQAVEARSDAGGLLPRLAEVPFLVTVERLGAHLSHEDTSQATAHRKRDPRRLFAGSHEEREQE